MLTFTTESFARLENAARALASAHWDEVEAPLHGPGRYALDAGRYALLERLGMLHISAARCAGGMAGHPRGALAGYAAFTLVDCPHLPGTRLAALDGLYLAPWARGGLAALSLLRHAERALIRRGAGLVQYSSPESRPCDALYRRLGARPTERVWHKRLEAAPPPRGEGVLRESAPQSPDGTEAVPPRS